MAAKKGLTKSQIKRIIDAYVEKKQSPYKISQEMGISPTAILYHLKKNNVPLRNKHEGRRRWDIPEIEELRKLYESGISAYRLGKKFNTSPATIYLRLKAAGIKMRDYDDAVATTKQTMSESDRADIEYQKIKKWAKSKTLDEIRASLQSMDSVPESDKKTIKFYRRKFAIVVYTRKRADGTCDLCDQKAPFVDPDGDPYLECHHVRRLSDGGADSIENAVALCPNCHRKMHVLNLKTDFEKLQTKYTGARKMSPEKLDSIEEESGNSSRKTKKIPSTCGSMPSLGPFIREEDEDPYRIPSGKRS